MKPAQDIISIDAEGRFEADGWQAECVGECSPLLACNR
jgi:hypothetical protein